MLSAIDENTLIAPNLTYREMMCPICNRALAHVDLLIAWTKLRSGLGKPIRVNSGFRCQTKNDLTGGSPKSQHLIGRAFDVSSPEILDLITYDEDADEPNLEPFSFDILRSFHFRGIGIGRYFLHLDVRTGPPSFWRYKESGRIESITPPDFKVDSVA
jgi:hypothetical protein